MAPARDGLDLRSGHRRSGGRRRDALRRQGQRPSRMAAAGVPVPPAFVIGAEGYKRFRANGESLGGELMAEVATRIARTRGRNGQGLRRRRTSAARVRPLRAAVSMPGMMDTVLNLGLTAHSAFALARANGAPVSRWTPGSDFGGCSATPCWISIVRTGRRRARPRDPRPRGILARGVRCARAGDTRPRGGHGRTRPRRSYGAA